MSSPDFVIAGAPRCGTTSLAAYLADHPGVCFSPIKEPNYFCFDAEKLRMVNSESAYQRLFAAARPGQLLGEGSTAYLFSRKALGALLDRNPSARVILSVRNPVAMVTSHHQRKVYAFEENEPDFARAWALSAERAAGQAVSERCLAPQYLDYASIGRLGQQVERAMQVVPPNQLHVVVFDDLQVDPGSVYRKLLSFLGLEPDARDRFAVTNESAEHGYGRLARWLMHPPGIVRQAKQRLRRAFPAQMKALGASLHDLNRRGVPKVSLAPGPHAEMVAVFAEDVALLSHLLDRDLGHWLRDPPQPGRPVAATQGHDAAS